MPTKRQRRSRLPAHLPVPPAIFQFFLEQIEIDEVRGKIAPGLDWFRLKYPTVSPEVPRRLWTVAEDVVLTEWISETPGTRPAFWWLFSAPRATDETLLASGLRPGENFEFTEEPRMTIDPRRRVNKDGSIHGLGGGDYESHGLPEYWPYIDRDGKPYNTSEPVFYESEAAYLQRHNLLQPDESRRLTAKDFKPVKVEYGD